MRAQRPSPLASKRPCPQARWRPRRAPIDPGPGSVARREGLNVWIPVPDETVTIPRLLSAGWAAAPGTRFRINTPPGMRITISNLDAAEIDPLADAITEAVQTVGRASV